MCRERNGVRVLFYLFFSFIFLYLVYLFDDISIIIIYFHSLLESNRIILKNPYYLPIANQPLEI